VRGKRLREVPQEKVTKSKKQGKRTFNREVKKTKYQPKNGEEYEKGRRERHLISIRPELKPGKVKTLSCPGEEGLAEKRRSGKR